MVKSTMTAVGQNQQFIGLRVQADIAHLRSSITVNEDSIVCTRTLRLFAAVSFLWVTLVRPASFLAVATAIRGQYGTAKVRHVITTQSPHVLAEVIYCRCPHSMRSRVSK